MMSGHGRPAAHMRDSRRELAHTDLLTRMSAKQHEAMQADSQSRQTLRDVPSPTLMHLLTLPARFDQASSQRIKQCHADLPLPTPATIAMRFLRSYAPYASVCPECCDERRFTASQGGAQGAVAHVAAPTSAGQAVRRRCVVIAARAALAHAGARGARSTDAGRH